jgi:sulfatase maturation enzyme AslB (radical SAM superfamily)
MNNFILAAFLYLTFRCNCNCPYCVEKSLVIRDKYKDMNETTLYYILKKLLIINKTSNNIFLHFFGGEPLLNFEIVPMVYKKLLSEFPELKTIPSLLETNLTFIPDYLIDFLKQNKMYIMVALNAQPFSKPYLNGNDSVVDVCNNLEILKNNGINPIINTTIIDNYKYPDIEKMAYYILKNNFTWNLNPEINLSEPFEKVFTDIEKIITLLRTNKYDMNNFRFCERDNRPSRILVGIDYKKNIYSAIPEKSNFYGTIDDFLGSLKKSIKLYNGILINHYIHDKCKLCKYLRKCVLSRCTAIFNQNYKSENACKISFAVQTLLDKIEERKI